jgi:hypothetical protein
MKPVAAAAVFICCAVFLSPAEATSYFTETGYFPVGSVVYLFHSGTPEIQKAVAVHDTLPVYTFDGRCSPKETGKIAVFAVINNYYLSAKILSGKISAGDVAVKGRIGCMILEHKNDCVK